MINHKKIEAYFCGWTFPGAYCDDQNNRAEVHIKYADDTWQRIGYFPLESGEGSHNRRTSFLMAKTVLEHFLGYHVGDDRVRQLLIWPGKELCRLTPEDLRPFLQSVSQPAVLFTPGERRVFSRRERISSLCLMYLDQATLCLTITPR